MKKLIVIIALTLFTAAALRAENPDTLFTIKNVSKVIITEAPGTFKVEVEGLEGDSTFRSQFVDSYSVNSRVRSSQGWKFPWMKERDRSQCGDGSSPWEAGFGSFMFGFVSAPGDGSLDIEPGKSFEIALEEAISAIYTIPGSHTGFSLGLGFGWRNYRTTKGTRFVVSPDKVVSCEKWDDDITPGFSRLKMFSLSFPLLFRQGFSLGRLGSGMELRLGAVLNWNSHASVLSCGRYSSNEEVKDRTNYVGHRKFSVDLLGILKFNELIGVYAKYSPSPVLMEGYGPQFRSFSAGLIFIL